MVISFTNYTKNIHDHNFKTSFRTSDETTAVDVIPMPVNVDMSRKASENYFSKEMIDKSGIYDIWGFDLPLTPPSSPCRMMDFSSESTDFCFRLQPVCPAPEGNIDEEVMIPNYKKTDSIVIKDCMWGSLDVSNRKHDYPPTRFNTGETPNGKELSMESSDVPAKLLGVDPAEVFPPVTCLDDKMVLRDFSSSDSDDDTDIDVVTVEPKLSQNFDEMFPKSPEIISPPKTPDSVPDSSITSNYQPMINLNGIVNSSAIQNVSSVGTGSKASTLQERFSRASHNVLERKRRNELKSKFYNLRDCIPELHGNKKVPKVVILKQAISYIEEVKTEEITLKSEVQRQRKLHQELKKRLLNILRSKSSS